MKLQARHLVAVISLVAILAGVLFTGLVIGGATRNAAAALLQPSMWVTFGLPSARLTSDVMGALTVAALLGAAFTYRQTDRSVLWFLYVGSACAAVWTISSLSQIVLSYANFTALPLNRVLNLEALAIFVEGVDQARALLAQAAIASVLTAMCFRVRSLAPICVCAVAAVIALLPPPWTGHATTSDNHYLAVVTLSAHIAAATIWFGGVVALAALLLRSASVSVLSVAAHRFSPVALGCFVVVAITGTINASLRLDSVSQLLTTSYGTLLLLKIIAFIVIGSFGRRHRRNTLAALGAGDDSAFRKVIISESLVIAATFAIAVALSSSPPPGV